MADCSRLITANMEVACTDKPKKGLDGGMAVLINWDDINHAGSTVADEIITDLVLDSGKVGFKAEWFRDLASVNSAFTPDPEALDGFTHNFLCRLPTSAAEDADRAAELANGRFIVVVETKYKGVDSDDAFKVLGWETGLKLSELTWNTLENSGSMPYTLTTEEGEFETYPYHIFLETDYATSKATFDALFATV